MGFQHSIRRDSNYTTETPQVTFFPTATTILFSTPLLFDVISCWRKNKNKNLGINKIFFSSSSLSLHTHRWGIPDTVYSSSYPPLTLSLYLFEVDMITINRLEISSTRWAFFFSILFWILTVIFFSLLSDYPSLPLWLATDRLFSLVRPLWSMAHERQKNFRIRYASSSSSVFQRQRESSNNPPRGSTVYCIFISLFPNRVHHRLVTGDIKDCHLLFLSLINKKERCRRRRRQRVQPFLKRATCRKKWPTSRGIKAGQFLRYLFRFVLFFYIPCIDAPRYIFYSRGQEDRFETC